VHGCAQGIIFSVRPPKKSWKNIANLSGGEKTLSSLSLVFALHHFRPTPLYVMDEIDAALGALRVIRTLVTTLQLCTALPRATCHTCLRVQEGEARMRCSETENVVLPVELCRLLHVHYQT